MRDQLCVAEAGCVRLDKQTGRGTGERGFESDALAALLD